MDEVIDQALRSDADHWRAAEPDTANFSSPSAQTRRTRPVLAIAACAAAVGVTVLATSLIGGEPKPVAADQRIPWTTPTAGTLESTHVAASAGSPACGNAELRPTMPVISGESPPTILVNLTYTGTDECWVSTYGPSAQLKNPSGSVVGADDGGTLEARTPDRISVKAGDVVTVGATWYRWCSAGATPTTLVLDPSGAPLDDQSGIPIDIPTVTTPPCTVPSLPGSTVENNLAAMSPSVAPAGSPRSLLPTINSPSSVDAGDPLAYTVTLHNTTATAIPLDPCPTYSQQLVSATSSRTLGVFQLLNCGAAPSVVNAGDALTFQMQASTTTSETGPAELTWSIANITDSLTTTPHARQPVTITLPS